MEGIVADRTVARSFVLVITIDYLSAAYLVMIARIILTPV